jgi:3-hydroxy acid dehydrogenase/malonic semialdehyde reductase
MIKTVLITGATSGIGAATALSLANEKYNLILCGRRMERLKEIEQQCKKAASVILLNFDVRDNNAVVDAINSLPQKGKEVDVLINNAGNAHGLSPVQEGDLEDWDAMIDINVKGLLYVSHAIIPHMAERKSGHIINIGSIAGKEVYPKGNVYCASKHAVDAITNGMRLDLNEFGIKVTGIHPGLVETEFSLVRFKGDEHRAEKVYEGIQPLKAEDVAEVIVFTMERPAHVNIADLVLFPTDQASSTLLNRG